MKRLAMIAAVLGFISTYLAGASATKRPGSWAADNGNGTYSNPLFYEEFSDPDVIRVGQDYYLAGTTMHAMPGLILLHSRDLVNWELSSYAFSRLALSRAFELRGGEIYGQGVWAPCIRYHNGTFYLFTNINNFGTHVFRSKNPKGPWQHTRLATPLYDLSVLFDDDGKIWAVSGAHEITLTQLNPEITDVVPNTAHVIIRKDQGMGEGLHFYRIGGKYYIVSAIPGAHTDMMVARARTLDGPWTVERMVSSESLGVPTQNSLRIDGTGANANFIAVPNEPGAQGGLTIHQGSIVDTPSGEWWSVIMQDHGSVGRLSCLVPVTWSDDFPIIGLPGNLRKAPNTWIKPDTGVRQDPKPAFVRNDNFDSGNLLEVWQWNHVPDDTKWSLSEKPGMLRLHSLPSADFWMARNTLTQRAIGPESVVTVELDASGMQSGDTAGLALLNQPYAWIGLSRTADELNLQLFDQSDRKNIIKPAKKMHVWLRAACNFDAEKAVFSWSMDGKKFAKIGDSFTMIYQLKTFQGIRYSLFHYNTKGLAGGYADFDNFTVDEPRAAGVERSIPLGRHVVFRSVADGALLDVGSRGPFLVVDRGLGRVALKTNGKFVSAGQDGKVALKAIRALTDAETFQWVNLLQGHMMLMSLTNHRYLSTAAGAVTATSSGPTPDRRDGACFTWK